MPKVQHKDQVTIPTSVRHQAGQRSKIVIAPKLVIDRTQFPNADGEYTPEQRRIIDARLDMAAGKVRKAASLRPLKPSKNSPLL